jgi:hypothetical protein
MSNARMTGTKACGEDMGIEAEYLPECHLCRPKEAHTATDWQVYHAGFRKKTRSNQNRVFQTHN